MLAPMVPPSEVEARLARLRQALRAQELDAALLLHGTDVFYFSGTRQNATLWVPREGAPLLLVKKSLARARGESPLAAEPFPPSKELPQRLAARRVGMTQDTVPVAVERFWRRILGGAEVVDLAPALRAQRAVKSPWEVERVRETGALLCGVLRELPSFLRPGMREVELAAEVEARLRRGGNEGTPRLHGFNQDFFMGLALAGPSSTAPGAFDGPVTGRGLSVASPLGASLDPIPRDAPVLVDYTAVREGYVADMTRVAVCGRLAPELSRAFDLSLAIQDDLAARLRPGEIPSALWERARAMAEAGGLGHCFMGPPGDQARFVGHGVGLELDEWPVLAPGFDAPLAEGNVVALEPKFVLPELGAVGIENTWAVGPGGGERLTEMDDGVVSV